jgi:hypothetical protein
MSDAKLPLAYRDSCAHLLIPLNRCRREEYYLPWKCEVRVTLIKNGPVEVANIIASAYNDADGRLCRPNDIPTRSANTRSSRSELRRWTRSERRRMERGATNQPPAEFSTNLLACTYIQESRRIETSRPKPTASMAKSSSNRQANLRSPTSWRLSLEKSADNSTKFSKLDL